MMSLPDEDPLLPPINDGRRPSRLDLARHATGELHLSPPPSDAWLRTLEAERARTPAFDMAILSAHAERLVDDPPRPPRRSFFSWPRIAMVLLSVGAVVAVTAKPAPPPTSVAASEDLDGVKGSGQRKGDTEYHRTIEKVEKETLSTTTAATSGGAGTDDDLPDVALMRVLIERGGKVMKGRHDNELAGGDLVGFRCFSAAFDRVTLVAVDAAGAISAPEGGEALTPTPLRVNEKQDLDFHFAVTPPVDATILAFFGEWTATDIRATVEKEWSSGGVAALDRLAEAHPDIEMATLHTP